MSGGGGGSLSMTSGTLSHRYGLGGLMVLRHQVAWFKGFRPLISDLKVVRVLLIHIVTGWPGCFRSPEASCMWHMDCCTR